MALKYYRLKDELEVGVDECARGCMAGRVYAGAVIWHQEDPEVEPGYKIPKICDSKKLSHKQRAIAKEYIEAYAVDYAVAYATEEEIDKLNIMNATYLAMHRALRKLKTDFDNILVDGTRFLPFCTYPHYCIEKGDNTYYSIACASILAKEAHDDYVENLVAQYPALEKYGWQNNMCYGSSEHIEAIKKYGLTKFHRKTFGICKTIKKKHKTLG